MSITELAAGRRGSSGPRTPSRARRRPRTRPCAAGAARWHAASCASPQPQSVDGGLDRARRGLPETADRRVAHALAHLARSARSRRARRALPPERSRASASCWRTVPTRHGTHWPHDSSRKKAAIRISMRGRSTVSSITSTTPEPSVVFAVARRLQGQRQVELVGPHEAAGRAAEQHGLQRPAPGTPPASSSSSPQRRAERHLVDAGTRDVARRRRTASCRSTPRCRWPRRPGRPWQHVEHVDERLDVVDRRSACRTARRRPGTAACCAARRGSPRSS